MAADDAAAVVVAGLRATRGSPRVLTKIVASEQPATIAEIISIFNRIARRAPRIITSASSLTSVYSRRVRFQSVVASERARGPMVSLPVGIARVMAAERAALLRGAGTGARRTP